MADRKTATDGLEAFKRASGELDEVAKKLSSVVARAADHQTAIGGAHVEVFCSVCNRAHLAIELNPFQQPTSICAACRLELPRGRLSLSQLAEQRPETFWPMDPDDT